MTPVNSEDFLIEVVHTVMDTDTTKKPVLRDPYTGHLLPGTAVPCGGAARGERPLAQIKRQMYAYFKEGDKLQQVFDSLFDLALHASPRIRREAITEILDRLMGRPKESIDLDVTGRAGLPDPSTLSDEMVDQIAAVLRGGAAELPARDPDLDGVILDIDPLPSTCTPSSTPDCR